jgi:DNA-directed RNA polymerase subunit RPC12/RpoP
MARLATATYLEAEVKCLHCGHEAGLLRRDRDVPDSRFVYLSSDGSPERPVSKLTDIRCQRCRGSVYLDEMETRYVYPKVDLLVADDEPLRRGRPSKQLIALRRAEEAALKSA